MASIPDSPTLSDLQAYQQAVCSERGWDRSTLTETWLLFTEEVGELAKALRHSQKLYDEKGKSGPELESEMADVLSYLLELANRSGVDLEQAYRDKEAQNSGRSWN